MRLLPFLLISTLTLVLMAGETDAEKEPLWSRGVGGEVYSVAISADGKYITAGAGSVLYLFDKTVPELVVEEDEEEKTDEEAIEEWKAFWFPVQVSILVILASLLYVRRETGYENSTNKVIKIFLFGISILLLLGSLIVLILAGIILILIDAPEEMRNPGWMWLLFAIIFALVGSFLGYESNSYSSTSYQSAGTSSFPSSKPIFANKRPAPIFKPQNETTTIECPGCSSRMDVPKLGAIQTVTCESCGLSGEIDI